MPVPGTPPPLPPPRRPYLLSEVGDQSLHVGDELGVRHKERVRLRHVPQVGGQVWRAVRAEEAGGGCVASVDYVRQVGDS